MLRKSLLFTAFLLAFAVNSNAQCAMCKAQLESNDGGVGNGINSGIIFLMIIPYVLLVTLLLVFFKGRLKSSLSKFINN
jgi:hypothetical protein